MNSAWNGNWKIWSEVDAARNAGVRVIHRVSMPTFELAHIPVEHDDEGHAHMPAEKDRPWRMVKAVGSDEAIRTSLATCASSEKTPTSA